MASRPRSEMSTRQNKKRDSKPMYMKSKYITMSNDILGYRNQNTNRSAWKSNVDDILYDKVFLERRNLIGQWYETWSEVQRKRFFDFILDQSSTPELKFILAWFKQPVRPQQDFTTLLPRVVSTHIFSYLDPRSLCRAAGVSWHWKWLVEQDAVWRSKCLKFGWYLPYQPSSLENGAWKKHYMMCIKTLEIEVPHKSANSLHEKYSHILKALTAGKYQSESDIAARAYSKWKKNLPVVHKDEPIRPPWIANSSRPKELEFADKVLRGKKSPEKQSSGLTALEAPTTRSKHFRSKTTPVHIPGSGQYQDHSLRRTRSEEFRLFGEHEANPATLTLSEAMRYEILYQTDGMTFELDENQNFIQNDRKSSKKLKSSQLYSDVDAKKSLQEFSLAYPNIVNPRVIFISSKITAHEVLASSVLYGVLPIVYQYEGTTLRGLLDHFSAVLQGRKARSVGLFVHGESGILDITRDSRTSLSSLNDAEIQNFWQSLSLDILNQDEGGHVDIFSPLGATDVGMELLSQLQIATGLIFSSPTGTTSSLLKGDDSWLPVPEKDVEKPSSLYFNEIKLAAWSKTAEYIQESLNKVSAELTGHFEDEIYGLASKIVGEIIFKVLGLVELNEIQDVSRILVKALVLMTKQKQIEKAKPVASLIHCLKECEKEQNPRKKRARKKMKKAPLDEKEPLKEGEDVYSEDEFESEDEQWRLNEGTTNANLTERLSLGERRSVIAHELLSTEKDYCKTLSIIQDTFRKPLEASIKSNRPVIGSANIRMIFNDSETLLAVNKELENDLSCRLKDWDSHQCLGDVFLKFNTKSKAYINFLNNYPITLATIDKCQKQHPAFRGFLLQLEKQPSTKLSSLPNLLLAPTKRVHEYICLLESFLCQTSVEHKDHKKLIKAIEQLKQLRLLFDEASTRLRLEKRLKEVQQQIQNCPALVERGRYFMKQEDVIHLKQTDENDVKAEFRVFNNIGNLGLFLFNDCLVLTTKNLTAVPFQRILEISYKYHQSVPLSTLTLEEISDTKYAQNAFVIVTPKKRWICQARSSEAKSNWISLLNTCKRTTIESGNTRDKF
ncbi:epithelial cell-transforming sequence 2 oncogene-like [Dendronephthya gigantea]|uniref:epithelial cell-transforming sequence 2 oncogene-like n=1 Tax=Dendronephthya gigantea TaxID=151771 RepID=UPI00106D7425|nr:epithelial cell-transforming sequence 2 oncogene-like [Dendronephthya gigantea]XP_028411574.1 epithelial cell-transforming sequence 2 oncogene-like [Dendronephthya gigantea]XP_028411575.1 epithelial cell-transforming sequence 2 oncogene-like [Dendronephthya gigantea]